jgi:AcrR family transcriptional regulator
MAVETPSQQRKDARNNREAILDAARALFADSADVAMSTIAKRAGVGQATLYRNFPNRGALAAEIIDEHVERVAALAAEHEGDSAAFFVLWRSMIDGMVSLYALAVLARKDAATDEHLKRARKRIAEILTGPLCEAKATGALRRDLSLEDLFLLLAMGRGAMEGLPDAAARSAVAHRVLALQLGGIESR